MKTSRIDIGSIRREQIVDAAVAVIAEQGLQKLSLSEIEQKVGMSRGQLMYYFKAKEDILLAVFDRLLDMMSPQHGGDPAGPPQGHPVAQMRLRGMGGPLLQVIPPKPKPHPGVGSRQY